MRFAPELAPATLRVLVVDDDEAVGRAISRGLGASDYVVSTATSGLAALRYVEEHRVDAVVCDVHMPGMGGLELLKHLQRIAPETVVVMLSGINDASVATAALANGAFDYMLKPVPAHAIAASLDRALRRREITAVEQSITSLIRREVEQRAATSAAAVDEARAITLGIVETLVKIMELKDPYVRGHSQRVAELAASTAAELGLDDDAIEQVRVAGRLHEVGKIGIREAVLNKAGTLTPEEYEHVRSYVQVGVELLAPLAFLGDAVTFVAQHHERWDGSGYPEGLAGTDIALGARILAVADTYDAIVSVRPFRAAMEEPEAIAYVRSLAGTLLDPQVTEAFIAVIARRKALPFLEVGDEPIRQAS